MALECGYWVIVREPETHWWKRRDVDAMVERNTHGVGRDVILSMLSRYESDFRIPSILRSWRP
jgi:hypothetical protein